MQIRVANRQDEPAIRAIVNEARAARNEAEIDLSDADRDLNGLEAQYFARNGVFLVAEEADKVVGLIGLRPSAHESTLEVMRLAVAADQRGHGVARKLIDAGLFFARNADYQQITVYPERHNLTVDRPFSPFLVHPGGSIWTCSLERSPYVTSAI